jgi:flagellar biosynthesis protein FlhB
MAEKTHDPTPKRLREARAKGDVPRAPLLAGALGGFVVIALVPSLVVALARNLSSSLSSLGEGVHRLDAWALGGTILALVAPIAVSLVVVAVVSAIAQGSLGFSAARLAPDPARLDPLGGLKNLTDRTRAWGAARGLAVTAVLVWVLGRLVFEAIRRGARTSSGVAQAVSLAGAMAQRIAVAAAIVAAMMAAIDVLISRRLWLGRHRMTRAEVMRERKEDEGDPETKRRRVELQHELLATEAMVAVRDATVVVVSPRHACALRYRGDGGDDEAPELVIKAEGPLAARILDEARACGIPIVRDVPVARALYQLEIGVEIPEALYAAVAEVLRTAWSDAPKPP